METSAALPESRTTFPSVPAATRERGLWPVDEVLGQAVQCRPSGVLATEGLSARAFLLRQGARALFVLLGS